MIILNKKRILTYEKDAKRLTEKQKTPYHKKQLNQIELFLNYFLSESTTVPICVADV